MNIIAVDDERLALSSLEHSIKEVAKDAIITCFLTAKEAIEYAKENNVEVAFLDIQMGDMNGLALAKKLKEINSVTNVIFVTGYSDYMDEAFKMYASGYVLKPIDSKRVKDEFENLRNPIQEQDKGIRVQCFGSFDVYIDGKPISFKRSKAKEALAYLVCKKGANVSNRELAAILWEDKSYSHSLQSHLYAVVSEMIRCLGEVGASHIIRKKRGVYSVDTTAFTCDFYGFRKGITKDVNRYSGEFMIQYSWAEFIIGDLNSQLY